MATFGIIISNRSFFPDHLVRTAREKLLAALDAWGHQYVTLSPEDTCMGQTMTYEEAVKCAELFRRRDYGHHHLHILHIKRAYRVAALLCVQKHFFRCNK